MPRAYIDTDIIDGWIADYNNGATWHDIQDQVDAYIMQLDGQGMTMDRNIIKARMQKTNAILTMIELQVNK